MFVLLFPFWNNLWHLSGLFPPAGLLTYSYILEKFQTDYLVSIGSVDCHRDMPFIFFFFALLYTSPPVKYFLNGTWFLLLFFSVSISPGVAGLRSYVPLEEESDVAGRGVSSAEASLVSDTLREVPRALTTRSLRESLTSKGIQHLLCIRLFKVVSFAIFQASLRSSRTPFNFIYGRVPLMFLGCCGYFLEEQWALRTFLVALDSGSPVLSCFPSLICSRRWYRALWVFKV